VKWDIQTPEEIYGLWRALGQSFGIFTAYNHNKVRVSLYKLLPPNVGLSYQNRDQFETQYSPGMLKYDIAKELLFIKCHKGWIGCSELQLDGKKPISADAFVNGYHLRNVKLPDVAHKFVNCKFNQ